MVRISNTGSVFTIEPVDKVRTMTIKEVTKEKRSKPYEKLKPPTQFELSRRVMAHANLCNDMYLKTNALRAMALQKVEVSLH